MRCVLIAFLLALTSTSSSFAQHDGDIVAARSAELVERIADSHPRLLIRPVDVPALRSFFKELRSQSDGAAQAKAIMPPLDARALTPEPKAVKNGTPEGSRQWQAGFKAANEAGSWAQRYALAWLLSEDPAYGREAARWLVHLAGWRITRDTYRSNDELFIQHLRPMIFAYDWAYGALTPGERAVVSQALQERLAILAGFIQPKLSLIRPTPPDNALSHPMRFVSTLGQGGLALLHETPDAARWLAWAYEYYQRQFPVWGGPAGGWAEGLNYWNTGMTQHQRFLEGMALLGFDAPLKRSFWRNTPYFGVYGLMPYPGSSFGDLTNSMPTSGSIRLLMEKFARLNGDPYPLAFARVLSNTLPSDFNYFTYDAIDAFLERFRAGQAPLPEVRLADLPQSRYFDDIGVVNMHSALGDAARDIMFSFRSSPQGSASHGFSDQNSFVLNAFGQPLAVNSGYREFYDSPHHMGWTRQTKAKNAVLFGGQGQRVKDATATGRIARFADGDGFSFATGDAQRAYAPHAERALRHVFFVDRRYIVLLDEVAAAAPVPFQWLLHARREMLVTPARNEITVRQQDARLTVSLLYPAPGELVFSQTDAFDPPVDPAWRAKMPNEWHVAAESAPTRQLDFLALLYPWEDKNGGAAPDVLTVPAARGFALRVGENALVMMAREAEKRVEAGAWTLDGMAANITSLAGKQRFVLVEATRIDGAWSLAASRPVSAEGTSAADEFSLALRLDDAVTLTIRPGFAVRHVSGATEWQRERDGRVRVALAAGAVRLVLRP